MAKNGLSEILLKVGAPFLKSAIEGALPPPLDKIGGKAVEVLAESLGTEPSEAAIVERYEADPAQAGQVIAAIEANPEAILAGVLQQRETNALLLAEQKEHWFAWAWRPAGMWGLGVLWFWNIIALHALNAIFKIALPPTDPWVLFQLSALYMGLYMGGHTVKDFVATKWGKA